jgi:hypothetical protein
MRLGKAALGGAALGVLIEVPRLVSHPLPVTPDEIAALVGRIGGAVLLGAGLFVLAVLLFDRRPNNSD